jgi:hypothetical protein
MRTVALVKSPRRLSRPAASPRIPKSSTRAAASSIASGRPSSLRQLSVSRRTPPPHHDRHTTSGWHELITR